MNLPDQLLHVAETCPDREADALRSIARQVREKLEWQPTATAPRDGTQILLRLEVEGNAFPYTTGVWFPRRGVWGVSMQGDTLHYFEEERVSGWRHI